MSETVGSKRAVSEHVSHENPLVPYSRMKQMYAGIVELRMLEEMLRRRSPKAKQLDTRGQEACRVSTLIGLEPQDFISDAGGGIGAAFLRGATLANIVGYADAVASEKKQGHAAAKLNLPGLLPSTEKIADRFKLAAGAALALKRLRLPRLVVFFATGQEMRSSAGKKTLQLAAREELPMLFVALPDAAAKRSGKEAKTFRLSAWAHAAGVPGIPVDANDAVALYRIVQESIGRLRGGDGPALMECISSVVEGRKKVVSDSASMMGETLLHKGACDERWLAAVSSAFAARLKALR